MISRWLLYVRRISRILWVRVVLLSLLSLLALAVAPLLTRYIPDGWRYRFGRDAVLPVVTILASGMLAVTTFSLNVMVSAYRTASTMATPRVYRLLLEDTITQSVLATFMGGFIYSLSAVILFRAQLYSPDAAVVVFGLTVVIVVLIVAAILRWIDHLSGLGSMDHTLRLIEARTRNALRQRAEVPCLGGCCATSGERPRDAVAIPSPASGFLRFIDMPKLDALAQDAGLEIMLERLPGDFVLRGRPIAWAAGKGAPPPEDFAKDASKLFEIGDVRSFDQDPAFGLTLLAETAQRALSPGVNDPGTAIEVMGRLERLLWESMPEENGRGSGDADFPSISLPPVTPRQLLSYSFPPIASCAGDMPEVMHWMDNALEALSAHPDPEMARAAQRMRGELTGGHH